MVVGVEQMRKIALFKFCQPEGFRELGQLEGNGVLAPVADLTQFETESMQCVDDGITVVPLEILRKNGQRLFSTSTPILQLEEKLLYARVTRVSKRVMAGISVASDRRGDDLGRGADS